MLPARVHVEFTLIIPCVMHPTLQDTTTHTQCFQLAFTSILSNHTLRHAPHTTTYHTRTHMLPPRVHVNSQ